MDLNLQYWMKERQPFYQRFLQWVDILDPTALLASDGEIQNARRLINNYDRVSTDPTEEKKIKEAWRISLSSVHPDTGNILPIVFRPPAFLPFAAPLVLATLLSHKGVRPAFFWQFLFQTYSAGFNLANRNASFKEKQLPLKQVLLCVGSISYTTCVAATPQFLMKRYGLNSHAMQVFFKKLLPAPLLACVSAFNIVAVRSMEFENGIEVMDKNGNVIGVSQKAGTRAVTETAVSRAALIGTTVAIPSLLVSFLQRANFVRSSLAVAPLRYMTTAVVLGLMLPVSFSLFPQTGKILRDELEQHIQVATTESELYYYRGV